MNHPLIRVITLIAALGAGLTQTSMANNSLLYIGTQDPARMGIAVAEFDADTGILSVAQAHHGDT